MLFKKLLNWILCLFKVKEVNTEKPYKIIIVSELPKIIFENEIYVEGNEAQKDYWYALLKCPCGCQENIMLNLMDDADPCWKLNLNDFGISVSPSIWRTVDCKSHFWLRNSKVIWV
ncbi:MAG: DUF6527 family protein [Aequorivita sp.]